MTEIKVHLALISGVCKEKQECRSQNMQQIIIVGTGLDRC